MYLLHEEFILRHGYIMPVPTGWRIHPLFSCVHLSAQAEKGQWKSKGEKS